MSKKKQTDNTDNISDNANNMPVPVADGSDGLTVINDGALVPAEDRAPIAENDGTVTELGGETQAPTEPRHINEYSADGEPHDERMSGGYASVRGSRYGSDGNRLVWIVLVVMCIFAVIIGVCSSLLTAHFMRKGDAPPVINTTDDVSQVAGVVSGRKMCIAEVNCGSLNGSGIVMKRDGDNIYVMTNAHVILSYIRDRHTPSVRFYGEDKYYEASVVGYDEHYDVAVLTLAHKTLYTVYDLDGSDYFDPAVSYAEGDRVVAIGNAMGFGTAVYDGIISRSYELLECDELLTQGSKKIVPVLRTTAVINAGMSGGALFDMNGRIVGLGTYRMSNSAGVDKDGGANTDVEDTGFVTPVSVLYPVYKQILREADGGSAAMISVGLRKVNSSAVGWIGTPFGFNLEYRNGKLTVVSVDSAVAPGGVAAGDVVTRIGGHTVTEDICKTVGALLCYKRQSDGDTLKITFVNVGTKTIEDYRYAL